MQSCVCAKLFVSVEGFMPDARTLLQKRKLCPKNLCHFKGSLQKLGTIWEQ
jgi:hypothetical protein